MAGCNGNVQQNRNVENVGKDEEKRLLLYLVSFQYTVKLFKLEIPARKSCSVTWHCVGDFSKWVLSFKFCGEIRDLAKM